MKIAYVYDVIYPWVKGGAEKRIWELSKRLSKKHDVHIYGMKYWKGKNVVEKDGVKLHGVCSSKELYTATGKRSVIQPIYFSKNLWMPLMHENFDVLDCCAFPYFPCFVSKFCSVKNSYKMFVTWHEVWDRYWYEYLGGFGIFGRAVEFFTSGLTTHNIAVSEKTKKQLIRLGVDERHIDVVPNGIDLKKIKKIKPSGEGFDILFAGRLIKEKNIDILLQTVEILKKTYPRIKCGIIGDGPEKKSLELLTKNLDLSRNVKFLGFLESEQVYATMKSSKVFVLPSTREGFGIVALEANACGLPVVTLKHEKSAVDELIENGKNGFLVDELSTLKISEKIDKLMDKKRWNEMSKNSIEFARVYDWDVIAKSIMKVYGGG